MPAVFPARDGSMNVTPTRLPEVLLIEPDVFGDDRGWFLETWHSRRYAEHGLPDRFVQDNASFSRRGVLRGLHCQYPEPQGKLITVLAGEVFDVAVDIRAGSPTFGQWVGVTLSGETLRQLYIPEGFAHGFCVTSPTALLTYKCTRHYNPQTEFSIAWNDPDIGIQWPVATPQLAAKDCQAPRLADFPTERLPPYPMGKTPA